MGPMYWGSIGQGMSDAQDKLSERTMNNLRIEMLRQQLQEQMRSTQGRDAANDWARTADFSSFFNTPTAAPAAARPPQVPPMPGTPSQPPPQMPPPMQPQPQPRPQMAGPPQIPPQGGGAPGAPPGMPPGGPPAIPPIGTAGMPPGMGQPQPQMRPVGMPAGAPGGPPQVGGMQAPPGPGAAPGGPPGAGALPGQVGPQIQPYTNPGNMPRPAGQGPAGAPQIAAPPKPPAEPGTPGSWNVPAMIQSMVKSGVPFDVAMDFAKKFEGALSPEQKAQIGMMDAQRRLAELQVKQEDERRKQAKDDQAAITARYRRDVLESQTLANQARANLENMKANKLKVQAQGGKPVPGAPGMTADAMEMDAYTRLFTGRYPPGYGKEATALKREIDNKAAQLAKDAGLTMAEAATLPAEKKADMVSLNNMVRWRDGVDRSSRAVENNIKIMQDWAAKLDLTDSKDVNAAMIAIKSRFGDQAAQAYMNSANVVMNEYARVMSGPTSNAQLAEGAVARAHEMLDRNMGPDQLVGVIDTMKREMAGQIKASDDVISERKGQLRSIGGGSRSATPAPASSPQTNAKGWKLMTDAKGNKAYVSPDGKQFEEVK